MEAPTCSYCSLSTLQGRPRGRTSSRALHDVSGVWPPSAVPVGPWEHPARRLGGPEGVRAWAGEECTALTSPHPTPRYYFKKVSDEFDCGVVFEEVREDEAVLPVFEEKIIGKVEKVD